MIKQDMVSGWTSESPEVPLSFKAEHWTFGVWAKVEEGSGWAVSAFSRLESQYVPDSVVPVSY